MHFSATALTLVLGLVAAAPRHEFHNDFAPSTTNSKVHLLKNEHGFSGAIIEFNIDTDPGLNMKSSHNEMSTMQEKIPGWVFLEGKRFQARIHGSTFWNIKGELEEDFPVEEFLFDPLVFTLNHPSDFEGPFIGKVGRGEINLKWEKSDASIIGRASMDKYYEFKGKTRIDWSP